MEEFDKQLTSSIKILEQNLELAKHFECNENIITCIKDFIFLVRKIYENKDSISENFTNHYNHIINGFNSNIYFSYEVPNAFSQVKFLTSEQRIQFKNQINSRINNLQKQLENLKFQDNFFQQTGFFKNNIVAVGANGSGKSSLSGKFKEYLENNGVVISAQRILLIPNVNTIQNHEYAKKKLYELTNIDKTYKNESIYYQIHEEFGIILNNLIAENTVASNQYRRQSLEKSYSGEVINKPVKTKIDIALEIWNELITHRKLECNDGINFTVKDGENSYAAIQMSDGEKVILYLIGQVLLAPENGFIVIDEPETFLHKAILKKLWDRLENEKSDCIFIYLTHDLDFASSRTSSKKLWIKHFKYPDTWEIEEINTDKFPESLIMELLGSKKNILFCEGEKGKIDEKTYSILFPNLTIFPVGSCFNVIYYTKSFNELEYVSTKAIGIIDADYQPQERLENLKNEKIYSVNFAEIENLLLDEKFLKLFSQKIYSEQTNIEEFKNKVIEKLTNDIIPQTSNYVSAKINYYFTDSDVSKANTKEEVTKNYKEFISKVNIETWYNEREKEIKKIVEEKDYYKCLLIYNNKGLKGFANSYFRITDFTERAMRFLQQEKEAQDILKKYFPDEIKGI